MPVGGKEGLKLNGRSPRWLEFDSEGADSLRGAVGESGSCML